MRVAFFVFFVLLIVNVAAMDELINNEKITGKAILQSTDLLVQVTSAPPSLSIISPKNNTYITNVSLLLNYIMSGGISVWYNLDNGQNITLSSTIHYFNTSVGSHSLYLFANNSDGYVSSSNLTFEINITKIIIFILINNFRFDRRCWTRFAVCHSKLN